MRSEIPAERLSHIVGMIYDCVIAPEKWGEVTDIIRLEFDFLEGFLTVNSLPMGPIAVHASAGLTQSEVAQFKSFSSEEVLELWGGGERVSLFPICEPLKQSLATTPSDRERSRWYQEWFKPRGVIDAIAIPVAREPTMIGSIGFGRHASVGEIGEAEISGLRLIAPHVRRAVTISRLFDFKAIKAATFASTIEAFAGGVVLIDETLAILHANTAAMAMLSHNDPILSRQGRLALSYKVGNRALEAAVFQATSDEAGFGQRGIGIPTRRNDGSPCILHVLPLGRGELRPGLMRGAALAVFLAPAASPARLPMDALGLLYDLTPAESRIFELICDGKTQTEIAAELGIAASTVKTHLLRVFGKTGCARQAELVKLAASFSLPLS